MNELFTNGNFLTQVISREGGGTQFEIENLCSIYLLLAIGFNLI